MRSVFKDDELEEEFQRNGYVRLPFISAEEVDFLKQRFFDTLPQSGGQISSAETGMENSLLITYDFTFIDKNPAYKREVFNIIYTHFKPHVDKLLDHYKPIIANYIRKQPNDGEVPLHQNWAFADERKCTTISIWCPLVDGTIENGTLQVVPGSHKRFGENRGPKIPWELENIQKAIIDKYLVPLETKAGDCVILDDSIVHYSDVNKTSGLRLAIQLICIPEEFPSLHYHMDHSVSSDTIEVLEVDKEFYMEFNPWKFPEHTKKVGEKKFRYQPLNEKEFSGMLFGQRFDREFPKKSVLQKIKGLFVH
jgi:ectoine hydroxylase-related dioxygenase (phytanoyl-CoA dioxygenase family)